MCIHIRCTLFYNKHLKYSPIYQWFVHLRISATSTRYSVISQLFQQAPVLLYNLYYFTHVYIDNNTYQISSLIFIKKRTLHLEKLFQSKIRSKQLSWTSQTQSLNSIHNRPACYFQIKAINKQTISIVFYKYDCSKMWKLTPCRCKN